MINLYTIENNFDKKRHEFKKGDIVLIKDKQYFGNDNYVLIEFIEDNNYKIIWDKKITINNLQITIDALFFFNIIKNRLNSNN